MNTAVKYFFLTMAFSPLWAFILRGIYDQKVAVLTIYGNVSLILVMLLYVKYSSKKIAVPSYWYLLFLLAVYIGIWDIFNGNINERGIEMIVARNYHLFSLATLILIWNTSFSKKFIRILIIIFCITVIPAFIVSMIQSTVSPFFMTPDSYMVENAAYLDNQYELRPPSIFAYLDYNEIGLSFIPLMSLVLGYGIRNYSSNLVISVIMMMAGLISVATNARYVMLNYITIFVQIFLVKKIKIGKFIKFATIGAMGIIFILFVLVNYLGYNLQEYLEQRLLSSSADTRLLAFGYLYKYFPDNPIFGTGVRVSEDLKAEIMYISSQIHVGYLSLLFEFGIVGGLLTFPLWYKITKEFYQTAKNTKYYGAYIGFITFLMCNAALVQYYIYFYGLVFLFVFSKHYLDEYHHQEGIPVNSLIRV